MPTYDNTSDNKVGIMMTHGFQKLCYMSFSVGSRVLQKLVTAATAPDVAGRDVHWFLGVWFDSQQVPHHR